VSDLKQKKLFEQFPPVTTQEWIDKINADLKGADFNRKMVWKTGEGFDVMPFYRSEDLENLNHVNGFGKLLENVDVKAKSVDETNKIVDKSWLVRQDIAVSDYRASNARALDILMKGIDSIGFIIKDPGSITEESLEVLLDNIIPEGVEINFLSEGKARELIGYLLRIFEKRGIPEGKLRGAVEADPLGRLMINGTLCIPVEAGFDYLASLTNETSQLPLYRNIQINGSNFRNAGAGIVQELGFSISMAVEYLSQLTDRGINAETAASRIRFSFGTGTDYFMEIAKLRAARILWSLIADGYGFAGAPASRMEIHSVTSRWNATVFDPYVNMLRTQTEAMSAILGGTDSLTVNHFDIASGKPGEFSERIARNQQLILREEAFFGRVTDPASGSYYIENLTSLIADNAWNLFLEVGEKGGFLSALRSGIIQDTIEKSALEKKENISKRKVIILGTNQYPNPDEVSALAHAEFTDPVGPDTEVKEVRPVRFARASDDFERIRLAVEKAPFRPVVFLLQAGNHTMRRARAQFSSGFFGCAGYRIIENDGYDDPGKGVEDALASGAHIIVICSSDEEYSGIAPRVLAGAGEKAIIIVAGNPPDIEDLKAKGLKNFISLRSDHGATLRYYNECLGIKE
jgi:methylmalonyl-CoA mutase